MNHKFFITIAAILLLFGCSQNYSNGERVGLITQFQNQGSAFKSWEGHLNMTQTGMNSSTSGFDFSIDNDNEPQDLVKTIDSAFQYGWKVKLVYHQVNGSYNCGNNRGHTDFFVTKCEVLDRDLTNETINGHKNKGSVIDTIYVIVVSKDMLKSK